MAFIVIEGLDGAGKSTQINMLQDYIKESGKHDCRLLHFPRTDSPVYGELIARFLRGELGEIHQVNPYLVALMYAGDRLDFKPTLNNWLNEGAVVLLDRYVYSNVAYQCAKFSGTPEYDTLRRWILHLEFEYHGLPKPDLNIFLNVPFEFTCQKLTVEREGKERTYLQGKQDIHEADLKFQENVRNTYLSLQYEPDFVTIDCSDGQEMLPAEQIFKKMIQILNQHNITL